MTTGAAVRSRMVHRALVERDAGGEADGYGNPPAPAWGALHAALPCWYYVPVARSQQGAEIVRERGIIVQEHSMMLIPSGTDITERDRVVSVSDRQGVSITPVAMNILSVVPRHDHIELTLRAVSE